MNVALPHYVSMLDAPNGLSFSLPWPPSVNHYWRSPNKGPLAGRHLLSAEGRAYRQAVALASVEMRAPRPRWAAPVRVDLLLEPPDRRRRDLDNYLKPVLDALVGIGMLEDDRWIRELFVAWRAPAPVGRVMVTLKRLEGLVP